MTILEVQEVLNEMAKIPGFEPGFSSIASLETIRRAYNGCGPERWPQNIRDRLDEMTALFAPSILTHDLDFEESDGTEEKLRDANERFHRNNKRVVAHYYPLWTWRMLRPSYRFNRAKAVAISCALNVATSDTLTRQAWRSSYSRRVLIVGHEGW